MTTKNTKAVSVVKAVNPTSTTTVATSAPTPGSNSGTAVVNPPSGFRQLLLALQQGIETVLPDGSTLASASGGYSKSAILAQLATWVGMYEAVDAQRQALQADLQQLRGVLPAAHAYYTSLKAALIGFFEPGNPMLSKFGFKPRKPKAKLPAQKQAAAVVRGLQTRVIRGTTGPKKRQQAPRFTGKIDPAAVVSAPEAAPASPPAVVSPTSAPAAGTGTTTVG